jgi:hypothetical protein
MLSRNCKIVDIHEVKDITLPLERSIIHLLRLARIVLERKELTKLHEIY